MANKINFDWREEFNENQKKIMLSLAFTLEPNITNLKNNLSNYNIKKDNGKAFLHKEIKEFMDKCLEIGYIEKISYYEKKLLNGLRYEILFYFYTI